MIFTSHYSSPLGKLLLASQNHHLIGLRIENQTPDLECYQESIIKNPDDPILQQTHARLDAYFRGEKPSIKALALAPHGNAFRQSVRALLKEIPYGSTTSYGALAEQIARIKGIPKMSAQAVGGAVGSNPISIIIPCHRVIGKTGNLTGYGGGLSLKTALLQHERVAMDGFFLPKPRS